MRIILNVATHGNEKIGLKVAKEIEKLKVSENILTIQIANRRALVLNKRFIDQDLNRSFPGKKNGNHEQRLAYTLSPIIKKADLVIDIHSTTSNLRDAIIITKLNEKTREYIKIIQPKYALIMSATENNALISRAKVGIAFEYGKDKDLLVLRKIVQDITGLLTYLGVVNAEDFSKKNIKTKYFKVATKVIKPEGYKLFKNIKNYQIVKRGQPYAHSGAKILVARRDFYPFLFGEKNYDDIFGFSGQRILI